MAVVESTSISALLARARDGDQEALNRLSGGGVLEPADGRESPSQLLLRKERELLVADALAQLSPEHREVILLRNLQQVAQELTTPLVIFYAVFVAGAGLWFQVRLVWFATVLAELGYCILVLDSWLRQADTGLLHHHLIVLIGLAILGYVVAYQVQRVRVMSQYYEHRPLP